MPTWYHIKAPYLRSVAEGLGCAGPVASSKRLDPSIKTAETFLEDLSKCLLANQHDPSHRYRSTPGGVTRRQKVVRLLPGPRSNTAALKYKRDGNIW